MQVIIWKRTAMTLTTGLFACTFHLILWTTALRGALIDEKAAIEDICQYEIFQPRCLKNEVVLISSASYGRMRIGRCITQEEVNAFETLGLVGSNPSKMGCSADVSDLVHRRCSGKNGCEVRSPDFSDANIHPCFPINKMYLEVSYDCISVVEEERSCVVAASKNPIHIIGPGTPDRKCGTKNQPFTIEAPLGEKVSIKLLEFSLSNSGESRREERCYGTIIDKTGRQNVSICGSRASQRKERNVHLSNGNTLDVILDSPKRDPMENKSIVIIKMEAIGCSNLIPPKDAWLKRMDDTIIIGCYTARQTWQLQCREGNWIGVFGNCSNGLDLPEQEVVPKAKPIAKPSDDKQVLVIVVIVGATLTFCLAVVCTGAVCLRRFYSKGQKYQEYKTLNFPTTTLGNQLENQQFPPPRVADVTNLSGSVDNITKDAVPTYSVYVGESGFTGSN